MWKQVKDFVKRNGGSQKGYCLRNVRMGYGIAPKYASAWADWQAGVQHKSNIPDGVDVPCYFWWFKYGHVGVRLADGRFWSDGKIYSSLTRYRVTHPAVLYRGWSTEVNDVRVIRKQALPPVKMPKVGSRIKLVYGTRTTFVNGTTRVAGRIKNPRGWVYIVRGYDKKYPNRIIINSKSGGGDGVALALYYTNGKKIQGWVYA